MEREELSGKRTAVGVPPAMLPARILMLGYAYSCTMIMINEPGFSSRTSFQRLHIAEFVLAWSSMLGAARARRSSCLGALSNIDPDDRPLDRLS